MIATAYYLISDQAVYAICAAVTFCFAMWLFFRGITNQ